MMERIMWTFPNGKTIEPVGGRVNLELNTGITYRPVSQLPWSDIGLSTDMTESRKRTVNRSSIKQSKGGKR